MNWRFHFIFRDTKFRFLGAYHSTWYFTLCSPVSSVAWPVRPSLIIICRSLKFMKLYKMKFQVKHDSFRNISFHFGSLIFSSHFMILSSWIAVFHSSLATFNWAKWNRKEPSHILRKNESRGNFSLIYSAFLKNVIHKDSLSNTLYSYRNSLSKISYKAWEWSKNWTSRTKISITALHVACMFLIFF